MTDKNGRTLIGKDGKPIMTREYQYTKKDGSKIIIQDHSAGHPQFGGEASKSHSNVRPRKTQELEKLQVQKAIIHLKNINMWLNNIENNETLRAIFKKKIPNLNNIHLRNFNISTGKELGLILILDVEEMPIK